MSLYCHYRQNLTLTFRKLREKNSKCCVASEILVLTAVFIKCNIFCGITPCSPLKVNFQRITLRYIPDDCTLNKPFILLNNISIWCFQNYVSEHKRPKFSLIQKWIRNCLLCNTTRNDAIMKTELFRIIAVTTESPIRSNDQGNQCVPNNCRKNIKEHLLSGNHEYSAQENKCLCLGIS
jgi:hypothetical protein